MSKITLQSAAGNAIVLGVVTRDTAAKAPLEARVKSPLANGRYSVAWKAMSNDGHVVNGTFSFRIGVTK